MFFSSKIFSKLQRKNSRYIIQLVKFIQLKYASYYNIINFNFLLQFLSETLWEVKNNGISEFFFLNSTNVKFQLVKIYDDREINQ